jgi:hypothetical protein
MHFQEHLHGDPISCNNILTLSGLDLSYRPPAGLAAARIDVRAFSVACIPAFVMLIVCCSMAS